MLLSSLAVTETGSTGPVRPPEVIENLNRDLTVRGH